MPIKTDVLIIGAGAAGMMCAIQAAQRGRTVVLLDHYHKLAEKIRISGGGRCNFTNLNARPENYLSNNSHFCRSALARYTPQDFIALLDKHGIAYHEKKLGQLFCDDGSGVIIAMLKAECDDASVQWCSPCKIESVKHEDGFQINTSKGNFQSESLVIACGGLSIPKIGATPLGYQVAEQFDIPITKLKPGLVPLSFAPDDWAAYQDLAGISLDAVVTVGKQSFHENVLFTHRGLSGPAILQISSYWQHGQALHIDLLPDCDIEPLLTAEQSNQKLLSNFLAQHLPKKFADVWCEQLSHNKPIKQYSEKQLAEIATQLHDWQIIPSGTVGYSKAEVTCGGIDTRTLSSKTMQANDVQGLYFIGEVVDVTGQLGGYNFQWAWASGYAAGIAV